MSDRVTPTLGDPPETPEKIRVSRSEIESFLKKKKLPITKKNIKATRARLRKRKERQSLPRGRDVSYVQSDAPRQVIYGEMMFGGVITFMHKTNANTQMNLIVTVSGHEIQSIDKLYLDGNEVTFGLGSTLYPADARWATGGTMPDGTAINYDSKVFLDYKTGTDSQTVQADAFSQMPSYWTEAHRQRGCAHVYLILTYDGTLFPDGIPEISFKGKGRKVYDPRTATTVYSNNAALCIADFLTNSRFGAGYSLSDLDVSDSPGGLEWAADICDENVNLKAGGTEDRYTLNAVFDMDMSPQEVLEDMVSAFGGTINYIGGKWKFWPGKFITPTITLTEDDLRGTPTIETLSSSRDRFNSIRGTFVSASNNFEVTDFPTIINADYILEDAGVENTEDVSLPCTTSAATAQRLAMRMLIESREGIVLRAPFGLRALNLVPGGTVYLTMSRYGWSSKAFRVEDLESYRAGSVQDFVIDLVLKEISASVDTWDETMSEKSVRLSPNTSLPNPFSVSTPSGLSLDSGTDQLIIQSDGTIVTRVRASWTATTDPFVIESGQVHVQFKRSSSSTWLDYGYIDGSAGEVFLLGLQDGLTYDVRVRFINALGAKSAFVTVSGYSVIGKTQPPSDISAFSSAVNTDGILLSWTEIPDLDRSHYEIRKGTSWALGEVVAASVRGNTFQYTAKQTGSFTFWIKAYDTTGNASSSAKSSAVTVSVSSAPQNLVFEVVDNNILMSWTAPTSQPFPVAYYNIYKGATATSENLVGRAFGTYSTYLVSIGGEFTFHIEPVDTGGNKGTSASKTALLYQPPDYILRDSGPLLVTGSTLTNAIQNGSAEAFIAPLIVGETVEDFFDNNSFTTLQEFIDAGYLAYLTPSYTGADATYEYEIDLGAVISSSRISFDYAKTDISGSCIVTSNIYYKELSGDSWTAAPTGSEVYASDFQFIKFKLTVDADSDDMALCLISDLAYRVDVKKATLSGRATSSSSGPTAITFDVAVLDVLSIQVTPAGTGTNTYTGIYDFTDVPNPTGFDAYVLNGSNTKVAVDFSWSAEVIINPT